MKAPITTERLDRIEAGAYEAGRKAARGNQFPVYLLVTETIPDLIEALRIAREALEDIKLRYDEEGRFAARDMWRVAYEALDHVEGRRG